MCSVVPLMGSKILPLRQFGQIFTLVTIISFVFAYGFFNALMMVAGPLTTRREASSSTPSGAAGPVAGAIDDAKIESVQLELADEAAWEMMSETERERRLWEEGLVA